jgi:hypothetical protein
MVLLVRILLLLGMVHLVVMVLLVLILLLLVMVLRVLIRLLLLLGMGLRLLLDMGFLELGILQFRADMECLLRLEFHSRLLHIRLYRE